MSEKDIERERDSAMVDSDDDEDPFMMFRKDKVIVFDEDAIQQDLEQEQAALGIEDIEDTVTLQSMSYIIDDLFLRKDVSGLDTLIVNSEGERYVSSYSKWF
jgi:hypothetical protein